jgi:hypothetical protein
MLRDSNHLAFVIALLLAVAYTSCARPRRFNSTIDSDGGRHSVADPDAPADQDTGCDRLTDSGT